MEEWRKGLVSRGGVETVSRSDNSNTGKNRETLGNWDKDGGEECVKLLKGEKIWQEGREKRVK